MASTFSALKIELIATGEQSGTWGNTTNVNLGSGGAGLEQAIVGMATLVTGDFTSNSYTMPYNDSNGLQNFRALVLNITATLTNVGTINVPAIQKPYIVINNSVGGFAVTVKVTGQTGVSVPNGARVLLYNNGTDVGTAITYLTTLTLGSALGVTSGGTGINSVAQGDILYGSAANTIQVLNKNTTASRYLSNSGTSNNPAWAQVDLTNGVTGILPSTNGGTSNGFFAVSGPASTTKTMTFPNANTTIVGTDTTQTLTNKAVLPRVSSTASISSPLAWNSDNFDQYSATAQAGALTINADAGTPVDGEKQIFCFTCDATPRVITFTGGASKAFKPVGVTLTTSGSNFTYTLTASKTTYFGAIYNSGSARWEIVALSQEA